MNVTVTEAEFNLTEVQAVTGLDPEVIRAWRKRNYLAPTERYAKVKTTEVASLMIRKHLLDHGFGPGDSWPIADKYAPSLLYFAILDTQACSVLATAQAHETFQAEFDDNDGFARRFSGLQGTPSRLLVSNDGAPLVPGEFPNITDDSLTGYYISLPGLGRQLYPLANKALFSVHVVTPSEGQGIEFRRAYPRFIGDADNAG